MRLNAERGSQQGAGSGPVDEEQQLQGCAAIRTSSEGPASLPAQLLFLHWN